MRFEFDDAGYVCCILYGCTTGSCVEYSGLVPNEPEAYTDMDDWADRAKVQAYKLDANGNLIYDAAKAAKLPAEDAVIKYTPEQCAALGIAHENHTHPAPQVDTSKITDIACGQSGKLKIGKTVIMWGTVEEADIRNNESKNAFRDCVIDYSGAGFTSTPCITASPCCTTRDAAAPYGIMLYVRHQSSSQATLRLTSNFTTSQLSVGLHWTAIGISN